MCLFVAFLLPSYLCKTSHSGVSFGIVLFSFQRSSRLAATCLSYQSIFALSRQAVKLLKTLSRWPCRSQHVFLATIKILASLLIPVKKKIVIFDARNIKIGTDFPCRFNRQMITVSRTETLYEPSSSRTYGVLFHGDHALRSPLSSRIDGIHRPTPKEHG